MAATPAPPAKPAPEPAAEKAPAPAPAPAASGGIKAWIPLLANVALMPALAYVTFAFIIQPKMLVRASSGPASAETAKGEEKPAAKGGKEAAGKAKIAVPLGAKILVNVAGTMGTRYLLANLTLVGTNPELKALVEKNDAELRDAAAGALSVKTINDLEKPGARNLIRTELMAIFNNVLGEGAVSEIYLTEFAIQ